MSLGIATTAFVKKKPPRFYHFGECKFTLLVQPRWFAAGWHDSVDDWPIPPDIHTRQCAQRGDWSDDIPSAVYPYSSSVSFELPLSSPALLLLARGSLGTGAVQISQITQPGDIAEVRVNVGYYLADAIDRARVCAITREVGGDGVGIFVGAR
jgi:hypothetical protein